MSLLKVLYGDLSRLVCDVFITSVANSGSGEVCCGRVGPGLAVPPVPRFISGAKPPRPMLVPGPEGRGDGVVGVASSLSHKT